MWLMAVFLHCAALLSFSPEIFKSAAIMGEGGDEALFSGYQLWHMQSVDCLSLCALAAYLIVSWLIVLCVCVCVCVYV